MKLFKKIVLWLAGIIATLTLAFIALHIYYRLTPVELSDEAKTLLKETAHMAQLTDNGYRMHGLLAPEGMDPVVYGKCIEKVHVEHAQEAHELHKQYESDAIRDAAFKTYSERLTQKTTQCANGRPELRGLQSPEAAGKTMLGLPLSAWILASTSPDGSIIKNRWQSVLDGGARGHGPDPTVAIIASYQTPLELERIAIAEFAKSWAEAKSDVEKFDAWHRLGVRVEPLVKFADGVLIESMIATAAVTRQLLAMQAAVNESPRLGDVLAREMHSSISAVSRLPNAVANSIAAEFQSAVAVSAGMTKGQYDDQTYAPIFINKIARYGFEQNDTLNVFAMGHRDAQRAILMKNKLDVSGSRVEKFAANLGCPVFGDWAWFCLPLDRNPSGRAMALIALPSYGTYGSRAWDVVNLAAATRLTIEARRRGLQGDALAQFVANAPAGMRDVYTEKPFSYDATTKKLKVELRTRSTVLGEKSYELSL